MLENTLLRLARETRGAADPNRALERARFRARSLAAAGGGDADAFRSAALVLAADVVVSLALERDWTRPEVEALTRDLGALLELPVENVVVELFPRALGDPRLLEPPPRLGVETQLRLLSAFCDVADASVWSRDDNDRPRLLAQIGAEPTRGMRDAARHALAGDERARAGTIRAFAIARWDRAEGAFVVRLGRGGDARRALALAAELAARLAPTIERARAFERRTERESALVEAAERRLARVGFDLHDGPVQEVLALGAELRLFKEQLRRALDGNRHAGIVLGRVDDLQARLVALDGELREVARSLETPTVLRTPLPELLRAEATQLEERSAVSVDLHLEGEFESLTPSQAIVLLRVVQEGLSNVEAHSDARTATVRVRAGLDELEATIRDDGRGFDVERTLVDAARGGRLGIVGMSERVRLLGGRLDVESRAGGPTTVLAAIPRWRPAEGPG